MQPSQGCQCQLPAIFFSANSSHLNISSMAYRYPSSDEEVVTSEIVEIEVFVFKKSMEGRTTQGITVQNTQKGVHIHAHTHATIPISLYSNSTF